MSAHDPKSLLVRATSSSGISDTAQHGAASDVGAIAHHAQVTAGIQATDAIPHVAPATRTEVGGRVGPEPTRFGDWEKNGRCIDF